MINLLVYWYTYGIQIGLECDKRGIIHKPLPYRIWKVFHLKEAHEYLKKGRK